MVLTNAGRSGISLLIGGGSSVPRYCGLGTGSGTEGVSNVILVTETGTRFDFSDRDVATPYETTLTHDYNSVKISGTTSIKEFGIFAATTGGSLFMREAFPDGITFDGTNELQIQTTFRVV